jgi:hypothetical protein
VQESDGERVALLRADKVAQRLAPRVQQLGLDALACVTSYPMSDDEVEYLYGWSPKEGQPPIMLFSTWGFDLPPQGVEVERMLTNLLAGGLAGIRGGLGCHHRGPKNCPLYYNPDRELKHLVGPLKFDAKCRGRYRRVSWRRSMHCSRHFPRRPKSGLVQPLVRGRSVPGNARGCRT